MSVAPIIRAGFIEEALPNSGEWIFVDPGFAKDKSRSCGLLTGSGECELVTFADLRARLVALATSNEGPMNLVIEAPLSVAFSALGNPGGRSFELRDGKTRYWYVGLGCSVLTSATYLLRAITDAKRNREIRLFEGFVSFKPKGIASDHCKDVLDLRGVVWGEEVVGCIASAKPLDPLHSIFSSFAVAGMNYGVPPIVVVGKSEVP